MTNNDRLAGMYPANKSQGENGAYPEETETVVVHEPGPDGYRNIECLDSDGNQVAANNRPKHRIRGALSGEYGYDIVV